MKIKDLINSIEWISIEDKKPNYNKNLLVLLDSGVITAAYIDSYGNIYPDGVDTNYDMAEVIFDSKIVKYIELED